MIYTIIMDNTNDIINYNYVLELILLPLVYELAEESGVSINIVSYKSPYNDFTMTIEPTIKTSWLVIFEITGETNKVLYCNYLITRFVKIYDTLEKSYNPEYIPLRDINSNSKHPLSYWDYND